MFTDVVKVLNQDDFLDNFQYWKCWSTFAIEISFALFGFVLHIIKIVWLIMLK